MKKGIIIVCVVVAVAALQFSHFMKNKPSKGEQSEEIRFVIEQVEVTADSTYALRDAEGNSFTTYAFPTSTAIKKGDIIAQEANSNELIVYRFDQEGKKEVVLAIKR